MSRHPHPALALSAGLALALSGCGAGLVRSTPTATSTYTPAIPGAGTGELSTTSNLNSSEPSASGSAPADAPADGVTGPTITVGSSSSPTPTTPPLAGTDFTRTASGSGDVVHLRFDILSLTRQGQLLQLAVRITSQDPVPTKTNTNPNYLAWNVDGLSDTSRSKQLIPTSGIGIAYSGTTLVDVAAKKRYLVAVDSSGTCLCTPDLYQNYEIGPGQSLTLNATYAAPPTATTKLDVDVPGIGDLPDVPIS